MPDRKLLLLAKNLRARAEEALTYAKTFKDAEAQRMMREIAASYERLEQASRDAGD